MADSPAASDLPTAVHPAVARMRPRWARCRDLAAGTDAIHAATTTYLPKHPQEREDDYKRRATMTAVYNAFGRTVRGMVGLVFQKDPQLGDDVPAALADHWENIDGAGTHGAVFLRRVFHDAMTVGLAGILVDYPVVPDAEALTLADERARALQPYWVHVRAENILSWRFAKVGGTWVLTQLVLEECQEVPDGAFGTVVRRQYRVYKRAGAVVTFELWREAVADGTAAGPTVTRVAAPGAMRNVTAIPFAPVVTDVPAGDGSLECAPPLLDLADLNLDHYRVRADRRHVMHLACVPVPVRKGYKPPVDGAAGGAVEAIGPNVLQDLPVDGDFSWAEVAGTAFEPTRLELQDLEQQMASVGLAFLAADTRAAETAEAKRIDSAAQNSSLATAARGEQDAAEAALGFHAQFLKLGSGGSLTMSREYEKALLTPAQLAAYAGMEAQGQLTMRTLWKIMATNGALPDDFDADEEEAELNAAAARLMPAMPDPTADPVDPNADPTAPPQDAPPADRVAA